MFLTAVGNIQDVDILLHKHIPEESNESQSERKGGFHLSALRGYGPNMPTSPPKSGWAKISNSEMSLEDVHIFTILGPNFPVACSNSFIPLISVWVLTRYELQTWLPHSPKQVLQAHASVFL